MAAEKRSFERTTPDEIVAAVMQKVPEGSETSQLRRSLEEQWEPLRERYDVARWLAKGLLWIFSFIIAWSGVLMMTLLIISATSSNIDSEQIDVVTGFVKELLPFIATPLGVALGFYFRELHPM